MDSTFDTDINMQLAERLVALHKKHYRGDIRDDANMNERDFNQKVYNCTVGMIREAIETKDVEVLQHMRDNGIQEAVAILETIAAGK